MPRPELAPSRRLFVASAAPSSRLAIAAVALAWLTVGCTTVPPARPSSTGDVLSGRLALRVDAVADTPPRALSAAFDLRGDSQTGTLGLSTPLGSMLAQARWSPVEVVLTTPRETRRFTSLDELTREALGESVPIEAWFDWLRGRPWPGAPSASSEPPIAGFRQLGWRVDLEQFGAGAIAATRESPTPVVTVRIRLDRS